MQRLQVRRLCARAGHSLEDQEYRKIYHESDAAQRYSRRSERRHVTVVPDLKTRIRLVCLVVGTLSEAVDLLC